MRDFALKISIVTACCTFVFGASAEDSGRARQDLTKLYLYLNDLSAVYLVKNRGENYLFSNCEMTFDGRNSYGPIYYRLDFRNADTLRAFNDAPMGPAVLISGNTNFFHVWQVIHKSGEERHDPGEPYGEIFLTSMEAATRMQNALTELMRYCRSGLLSNPDPYAPRK